MHRTTEEQRAWQVAQDADAECERLRCELAAMRSVAGRLIRGWTVTSDFREWHGLLTDALVPVSAAEYAAMCSLWEES